MYNDGFIEGSNNIRSDDSDEDYDEYDTEDDVDDDTCALLQLDLTVTSINLPEIQEVDTIAIAKQKAILAAQLVNGPCVVEDTSLEFHALGGMPGPYIKWFQETLKSQGMKNLFKTFFLR
jgi:inosine/xanthosine triphosphate pyrophosphatase family protein